MKKEQTNEKLPIFINMGNTEVNLEHSLTQIDEFIHQFNGKYPYYYVISNGDESKSKIYSVRIIRDYSQLDLEDEEYYKMLDLFRDSVLKTIEEDQSTTEIIPHDHLILYNTTETLALHFNDNTFSILYHYTGQW